MCITNSQAELSHTVLGSLVDYKKGTHSMFYMNNVVNESEEPNCMILPIPGEILELHDTTEYGNFLEEIVSQTNPVVSKGITSRGGGKIEIKEVGVYTCIVARRATKDEILNALTKVSIEKRPTISSELINWYFEFYGEKMNLVICCFNNTEMVKAQPMWIEFIPNHMDIVFFPGADSHDGTPPKIGKPVSRDHTVVFGVNGRGGNEDPETVKVEFSSQNVPEVLKDSEWNFSFQDKDNGNNCDWHFTLVSRKSNSWKGGEVTTPCYGAFA